MLRTMDGLDVASDLINELRELLQVHCGTVLGVLHILDALQQHAYNVNRYSLGECYPITTAGCL